MVVAVGETFLEPEVPVALKFEVILVAFVELQERVTLPPGVMLAALAVKETETVGPGGLISPGGNAAFATNMRRSPPRVPATAIRPAS